MGGGAVGLCQPDVGLSKVFTLGEGAPEKGRQLFFGDSVMLPVRYTPVLESGEDAGIPVVTLESGVDTGKYAQYFPALGGVEPALRGVVGDASVRALPKVIDFGEESVGCQSGPRTVDITRIGPKPIALAAAQGGACLDFQLGGLPELPAPLYQSPEEAIEATITFVPGQPGPAECTFEFLPNDVQADGATVTVTGEAAPTPDRVDEFEQAPVLAVDVLFIVDNSGSMGDEQEHVCVTYSAAIGMWATLM